MKGAATKSPLPLTFLGGSHILGISHLSEVKGPGEYEGRTFKPLKMPIHHHTRIWGQGLYDNTLPPKLSGSLSVKYWTFSSFKRTGLEQEEGTSKQGASGELLFEEWSHEI